MKPLAATLRQFIRDNFLFGQPLTFSDDDSLLEQGVIDSTGVLELVAFIESEFQVTLDDADLVPENLDSINSLLRFIEAKLTSKVCV